MDKDNQQDLDHCSIKAKGKISISSGKADEQHIEKHISDMVIKKVMAKISPLLERLRPPTQTTEQSTQIEDENAGEDNMEERIGNAVFEKVMADLNPLLERLRAIADQSVHQGAQAKVEELQKGIQEKINARINKINAVMSRGKF